MVAVALGSGPMDSAQMSAQLSVSKACLLSSSLFNVDICFIVVRGFVAFQVDSLLGSSDSHLRSLVWLE